MKKKYIKKVYVKELKKNDVFSFNENTTRYKVITAGKNGMTYQSLISKREYSRDFTGEIDLSKYYLWKTSY